jgi:hypothetical protein
MDTIFLVFTFRISKIYYNFFLYLLLVFEMAFVIPVGYAILGALGALTIGSTAAVVIVHKVKAAEI